MTTKTIACSIIVLMLSTVPSAAISKTEKGQTTSIPVRIVPDYKQMLDGSCLGSMQQNYMNAHTCHTCAFVASKDSGVPYETPRVSFNTAPITACAPNLTELAVGLPTAAHACPNIRWVLPLAVVVYNHTAPVYTGFGRINSSGIRRDSYLCAPCLCDDRVPCSDVSNIPHNSPNFVGPTPLSQFDSHGPTLYVVGVDGKNSISPGLLFHSPHFGDGKSGISH